MKRAAAGWTMLWVLYLCVLGSLRPGDLATGAVVAAVVLAACRRFHAATGLEDGGRRTARVHVRALPALAAATVIDVVRGTFDVARAVLRPTPRPAPGIVEVPLPEASAAGLATLMLAVTLSPGSVLVDVDRRRRMMRVHVIDARDPDRLRAHILAFDRRWRRPAVE